MELKSCPMCGSRRIVPVRETVRLGRLKRKLVVPDVPFERCEACGEEFFGRESNRIIDRYRPRRKLRTGS